MIGNNVYGGSNGSTEQLGIYPIGTDGRPTGAVTVPIGVTSLYEYIFENNTAVTSVNLPSSLNSIADNAFKNCTSLSSINIPSGVTSLGTSCFESCTSVSSIIIPSSVTSLGYRCFSYCTSLSSITIPSSVTSIGVQAFYCCTFSTVNCNALVCSFEANSFAQCTSLTTFNTVTGFNPTGLNLSYSTSLTVNSMVSMFNNLTTIGTTKTITLGATNLAKLSAEQKAIATGKGWTLA